jgi:hypothetical protein
MNALPSEVLDQPEKGAEKEPFEVVIVSPR